MNTILEAEKIVKVYNGSKVLREVSLTVSKGEFIAVMGQSGCGKSTLLYQISGMDMPDSGEIYFNGKTLHTLREKELSELRLNNMGFVFQKANLLRALSVRDNIVFPAYQALKASQKELNARAEKWMERTGILSIADGDVRKISGGQQQRAAICRALMNEPQILFADEPTGALNSSVTQEIMDIFNQINAEGTAILLVTHDGKVAARADRVIYLKGGMVEDELLLGTYDAEKLSERERKTADWLKTMDW